MAIVTHSLPSFTYAVCTQEQQTPEYKHEHPSSTSVLAVCLLFGTENLVPDGDERLA